MKFREIKGRDFTICNGDRCMEFEPYIQEFEHNDNCEWADDKPGKSKRSGRIKFLLLRNEIITGALNNINPCIFLSELTNPSKKKHAPQHIRLNKWFDHDVNFQSVNINHDDENVPFVSVIAEQNEYGTDMERLYSIVTLEFEVL